MSRRQRQEGEQPDARRQEEDQRGSTAQCRNQSPGEHEHECRRGEGPQAGESPVDPDHLGLAAPVAEILAPESGGTRAGRVTGGDPGGEHHDAAMSPDTLTQVGILGHPAREGPISSDQIQRLPGEGPQIDRVDRATSLGRAKTGGTRRPCFLHGFRDRGGET
jgi:hypothetical protein